MTALFLQVRLDSNRLPEKALKKIEDLTLIEHAMRALSSLDVAVKSLLTTKECVDRLKPFAEKFDFHVFAGPKDDVLERFLLAAKQFGVNRIIRATGDNPLVSPELASAVLEEHLSLNANYSNWTDAPLGTGVEIVEVESLKKAKELSLKLYDHEHVTPFVYNNPDLFDLNIKRVKDLYYCKSKVSIDTEEDLLKVKKIFKNLYKGVPIGIEELVEYLKEGKKTERININHSIDRRGQRNWTFKADAENVKRISK